MTQYVDTDGVVREEVVVEPAVVPVAPQPVVAQRVVAAVPTTAVVRRSFWQFDPAAVVTALVGVFMLIVGLVAMSKAGFDGPMEQPVVEVLGFTFTALLGIVVAIAGLFLLVAGASKSREGALFMGTVIGIAAFVGALQAESFQRQLAIEESFAWIVVALSLVVVAVNLIVPRVTSSSTVYERRI
jgi:hypothetical protein